MLSLGIAMAAFWSFGHDPETAAMSGIYHPYFAGADIGLIGPEGCHENRLPTAREKCHVLELGEAPYCWI